MTLSKSAIKSQKWRDRKRAKRSRLVEIAAAMSDADVDAQLEALRKAAPVASNAHLAKAMETELEDWLDIRLTRDCEKMLEKHSREWDEAHRPAFQKGLRFKPRPRPTPSIGDSICPYTGKQL